MAAHEYLKTPTALADFILEMYEDDDARLSSFQTSMKLAFTARIGGMESSLVQLKMRVRNAIAMKVSLMESAVDMLEAKIGAADPRRLLERGYALAVDADGVVIKGVQGKSEGDKVTVLFADGRLDCRIEQVVCGQGK